MSKYSDILDRLVAGEGSDMELDAAIAVAALGGKIEWLTANYTMESYPARKYASTDHVGGFGKEPISGYTSSIDAAIALVERLTPEGDRSQWWYMLDEAMLMIASTKRSGDMPRALLTVLFTKLREDEETISAESSQTSEPTSPAA